MALNLEIVRENEITGYYSGCNIEIVREIKITGYYYLACKEEGRGVQNTIIIVFGSSRTSRIPTDSLSGAFGAGQLVC